MKFDWKNELAVISAIKSGGLQRDRAIAFCYNESGVYERFVSYIQKNKGNKQDAEDVFHEALVILDNSIRNNKFKGESSLRTYFFSICKLTWMNKLRKKKRIKLVDGDEILDQEVQLNPEVLFITEERKELISSLLSQLGEKCALILKLWQLSYSMEEIAKITHASSALIARKAKYRCMKSLLKIIDDQHTLKKLIR